MSLPNKFQICTKYNRCTQHTLTKQPAGHYEMVHTNPSLEDAWDKPLEYSAAFVQACINEGSWIITKNLDEPEMKFPFTVLHKDFVDFPTRTYFVTKTEKDHASVMDDTGYLWEHCVSVDECKRLIKEGIWIVKHVGEKIEERLAQYTVKIDENGNMQAFGLVDAYTKPFVFVADKITIRNSRGDIVASSDEGSGTGFLKAPQSTTISTLKVDVECNTDAAVEAVERLKNAIESLNMAMESYIELKKEMKNV